MIAKSLTAALLGTTLLATAAFAQSSTTTTPTTDSARVAAPASTSTMSSQWRASKLVGLNVYNQANEKLGDINELLIDSSGKIQGVVIGVGGFLGMGEHDVKVSFDQLKWVNEPASSGTAMNSPATTTRPTSTTSTAPSTAPNGTVGSATTTTTTSTVRWYPDHAVFNASKDELKAMPQFRYDTK